MPSNELSFRKNALNKINLNHALFQKEFIKLLIGYDIQQKAINFFSDFLTSKSIDYLLKNEGFTYSQIHSLINFNNLAKDDRAKILELQLRFINENDDAYSMCLKDINTYVQIRFKEFLGE